MRIEIIGNIASGKTTLANLLGGAGTLRPVLEDFRSTPIWAVFYADMVGNAFETELIFTLLHYHAIKNELRTGNPFVCDFSLVLDQAYADVTLSGNRYKLYCAVLKELLDEIVPPRNASTYLAWRPFCLTESAPEVAPPKRQSPSAIAKFPVLSGLGGFWWWLFRHRRR